jgi:hypothetical protein
MNAPEDDDLDKLIRVATESAIEETAGVFAATESAIEETAGVFAATESAIEETAGVFAATESAIEDPRGPEVANDSGPDEAAVTLRNHLLAGRPLDREGMPIDWPTFERLNSDRTYKIVEETTIGTVVISTVWLGVSQGRPGDPALIFETMGFVTEGGAIDHARAGTLRLLYSSEAEARTGHARVKATAEELYARRALTMGALSGAIGKR